MHASMDGELASSQFQQYMGSYVRTSLPPFTSTSDSAMAMARQLPRICGANKLEVPAIHCSFPRELSPLYELVKEQCDRWIEEVAKPPSAAACQLLLNCLLPRLVCRTMSAASSLTRLVHATKMIAWLIIADDEDDHPAALGADDAATTHHASQVLSILRGLQHVHPPTPADAAATVDKPHSPSGLIEEEKRRENALLALASLWGDMQKEMSPLLSARFVSSMEDYQRAVKVQAIYRKAHRLPDIQAYREIRRHASFILPCFVLLEYALGIEVDDATYANSSIQEFRTAAMDYICLCNDLISCKVEIGVGDYFNMPSIVYVSQCNRNHRQYVAERNLDVGFAWSLQAAVNCVVDLAHDLDAQCVSMLHESNILLPAQAIAAGSAAESVDHHRVVSAYISGLCSCMSGCLAWFLETARYATT